MNRPQTDRETFERRVVRGEGCWEWPGAHSRGYSMHRNTYVHRTAYEIYKGPIPQGYDLDHLCRNRGCVNPDHLEPVTRAENNRRGLLGYGARTTCKNGLHDITDPANVSITGNAHRSCKPCQRAREAEYRQRRRAKAAA